MNKKAYLKILSYTLVTIALLLGLWFGINVYQKDIASNKIKLEEGWKIAVNDEVFDSVNLAQFSFPLTGKGDTILLQNTLNQHYEQPMLMLHIYHCVIHVTVGGEEIFSYGQNYIDNGQMIGSGYFMIPLPADSCGKILQIRYDVSENNAFTSLEPVYYEEASQATFNFCRERIVEILICGFLLIVSLIGLIASACVGIKQQVFGMSLWISIVALVAVLWTASSFGLLQFLSSDCHKNSMIEYTTLYLAPLAVLCYVHALFEKGIHKTILKYVIMADGAFTAVILFFSGIRKIHLQQVLPVFHITALLCFISIIICIVLQLRKEKTHAEITFLLGTMITVFLCAFDIVRFNLEKYVRSESSIRVSIVPLAALCMVITMIISYVQKVAKSYHDDIEKSILLKMAYTDNLTGLGNRAKCTELLKQLEDKKIPFGIMYMDLNCFKQINDVYGHAVGDEALKDFAFELSKIVGRYGFVGRMAGDEFVAVLQGEHITFADDYFEELEEELERFNRESKCCYRLEAACGYATSLEFKGMDALKICSEADERMYENKRRMKEKTAGKWEKSDKK